MASSPRRKPGSSFSSRVPRELDSGVRRNDDPQVSSAAEDAGLHPLVVGLDHHLDEAFEARLAHGFEQAQHAEGVDI